MGLVSSPTRAARVRARVGARVRARVRASVRARVRARGGGAAGEVRSGVERHLGCRSCGQGSGSWVRQRGWVRVAGAPCGYRV